MTKNLLIVTVGGAVKVENVLDYSIDQNGVHVTWGDESQEKVGDKIVTKVQERKDWFNIVGVMAVKEEYKK